MAVSDSFKTGHSDSNVCICEQLENSKHYFKQFTLYTIQRQNIITKLEQFIANFSLLAAERHLEIVNMGYEYTNPEMTKTNTKIMFIAQTYILQTKRFERTSCN